MQDKIFFRIKYYSREVLEYNLNYYENELPTTISKNNITIELTSIQYEQLSGKLIANFNFSTNEKQILEKLRFMLRVHDDKNIFYNKSVGDNSIFVGNIDYLLYNKNLYSKLSTKGFDTINLDENTNFNFSNLEDGKYKTFELTLDLGENYKISDNLYIEFLDLIYKPEYDNSYKIFDYLGEFKYKISF